MNSRFESGARTAAGNVKRSAVHTPAWLAVLALAAAQLAAAGEAPDHGWWFDIGIGPAALSTGSNAPVSGSGTWLDGVIGGRLNDRWLLGLQLGGVSANASSDINNDTDLGGTLTHAMLAVRYVPQADRGWVWGLGVGPAYYNNAAIEVFTGNYSSGSGWAGNAAVGYDWKFGHGKSHIEAMLSVEQGRISPSYPFTGHFNYSVIAASVHIASF